MRCPDCGGYRSNPDLDSFDIETANPDIDDEYNFSAHISSFPSLRNQIIDGNEKITDRTSIDIVFDYPLSRSVNLSFTNPSGFTRNDFYRCIYDGYTFIYSEEEADAGDPGHIPGMLNRAPSEGRYGIWGHDMGDLVIERVEHIGDGFYRLSIGS